MPAGANRCPEGGSHTTLWAGAQPVSRTQAPAGHEEDANDNAAPRGGSRPPPRPCPQPVRSIGGGGGGRARTDQDVCVCARGLCG